MDVTLHAHAMAHDFIYNLISELVRFLPVVQIVHIQEEVRECQPFIFFILKFFSGLLWIVGNNNRYGCCISVVSFQVTNFTVTNLFPLFILQSSTTRWLSYHDLILNMSYITGQARIGCTPREDKINSSSIELQLVKQTMSHKWQMTESVRVINRGKGIFKTHMLFRVSEWQPGRWIQCKIQGQSVDVAHQMTWRILFYGRRNTWTHFSVFSSLLGN